MHALRTPDERFVDLPDFPFEPHYVEVSDGEGGQLRVHYLDEGPRDGDVILLMHGEPSWAFLYRHMIPVLTAAGHRCIVPDLPGFGRSDKPSEQSDYSYGRLVTWMTEALLGVLDLHDVTFFGQDWGGLIGLRLVGEHPDRFTRVVVANTGLPTGDREPTKAFMAWQKFTQESPVFPIGGIVNGGSATDLTPEVIAAYDAPFPDETYKSGARILPSLVPTGPDDPAATANRASWETLRAFDKPFLLAFSDLDAVTAGGDRIFLREVPGTSGQPHTTVVGGGHFLQEDKGPELAAIINAFIAANPT